MTTNKKDDKNQKLIPPKERLTPGGRRLPATDDKSPLCQSCDGEGVVTRRGEEEECNTCAGRGVI